MEVSYSSVAVNYKLKIRRWFIYLEYHLLRCDAVEECVEQANRQ
jgi:hypothetical protein